MSSAVQPADMEEVGDFLPPVRLIPYFQKGTVLQMQTV